MGRSAQGALEREVLAALGSLDALCGPPQGDWAAASWRAALPTLLLLPVRRLRSRRSQLGRDLTFTRPTTQGKFFKTMRTSV